MSVRSSKKLSINPAGVWAWDDNSCGLVYLNSTVLECGRATEARLQGATDNLAALVPGFDSLAKADEPAVEAAARRKRPGPVLRLPPSLQISFRNEIDLVDQMHFRRTYQRRLAPGEPDIVTLRDVKDVVLFLAVPRPPVEFLQLFFTKRADRFLRALILYFRIYLQTYSELCNKREALAKKLALPVVGMVEHMRQDLSDARALVGRDYACLLMERARCWLQRGLTTRETDTRDMKIVEPLIRMSSRVVWVCLGRRSLWLIERETNRLFRADAYNIAERRQRRHFVRTPVDDPPADTCKLNVCSPATLELLNPSGDYRTLSLGVIDWLPKDARLATMETMLTCPEEEVDGSLGMLGRPRDGFDGMLRPLMPTKPIVSSALGSFTEASLDASFTQTKSRQKEAEASPRSQQSGHHQ